MLALFPQTATVRAGELVVGGAGVRELARQHDTPLLVYCEVTLRERARLFTTAAPGTEIVYGTKAFANVALLRLLAEEGIGADVSTLGELEVARRAGLTGAQLLVHGNNKSDDELAAAAGLDALLVVDELEEPERAAAAGVRRVLVRVTPGVEAETHEAIRTGHHGSKFGLGTEDALEAIRVGRERGLEVLGLHVHVGSQLADARAHLLAAHLLAEFAARCREELGWTPGLVDLGGGFPVRHTPEEPEADVVALVRELAGAVEGAWQARRLPVPRLVLEPGRSLVGPAAFTLYRVGAVKRAGERTYVAVDGGMSDNPRPQLYGARYVALLANRADERPSDAYTIVGKHCESGDVLIESAALPEPRRGDLLAVPATGAYTLAMGSNYNGVTRPAAVLVANGRARTILRRESLDDLLAREV